MRVKWHPTNFAIILLLIIFFPSGLYLMWKHSKWRRSVKIAISMLFAVFTIACFSPKDNNVKTNADITAQEQSGDDNQEEISQIAVGITKEYLESKLENIEIESIENAKENYYIINFKAKDNSTDKLIKKGILNDIKDISKTLVENKLVDDSKTFYFKAKGVVQEQDGADYGQGLVKGSELLKCNFDNMTYEDMEKIMDSFFMHPNLKSK